MMEERILPAEHSEESWLTPAYEYDQPRRGQVRDGVVLQMNDDGILVDIGLKRDGFVPAWDIKRLGDEALEELAPGKKVVARVAKLHDSSGNLILSLYQARFEVEWSKAAELKERGETVEAEVVGHNRGGLTVAFGHLQGFVPSSHLADGNLRRLAEAERRERLEGYVGQRLVLKVIEVNRDRRRLVMSERLARRAMRKRNMERLLNELKEGQVVRGTVRHLCGFGAFVDIGGADALIHISELAHRRVRHPSEVVQPGDEVEAYVLRVDADRKRIGLSLKRLQPDPWDLAAATYTEGQIVSGTVTSIADFGAFVLLDVGVEGLVHISELASPAPTSPQDVAQRGDTLVLRVLRIEPHRRRMGLSLRRVDAQEREEWLAEQQRRALEDAGQCAGAARDLDEYETAFAGDAVASPDDAPEDLPGGQSERPPQPNSEAYWKSLLEEEQ